MVHVCAQLRGAPKINHAKIVGNYTYKPVMEAANNVQLSLQYTQEQTKSTGCKNAIQYAESEKKIS
ncbi:hypothetical protein SEA27A368_40420 [Salmonella enterica]|nr:hypothetical protein SEA27A368_40420 [Salmonella enterica]